MYSQAAEAPRSVSRPSNQPAGSAAVDRDGWRSGPCDQRVAGISLARARVSSPSGMGGSEPGLIARPQISMAQATCYQPSFHHSGDHKDRFSEKVAILRDYTYDGEHKGAQWRLFVKPYLISRAPEIEEILKYVEAHDDVPMMVRDLLPKRIVPDDTLIGLASDLWGFLTLNLQGMARLFVNNSKSNGGSIYGKRW